MGHPDGPWEVRWRWSTGYNGTDRFHDAAKALIFCDEMFRRTKPPALEVSLSVRNTETGELLTDYMGKTSLSDSSMSLQPPQGHTADMATCGTCDGSGEIVIIQTGKKKKCSRCNGTGQE